MQILSLRPLSFRPGVTVARGALNPEMMVRLHRPEPSFRAKTQDPVRWPGDRLEEVRDSKAVDRENGPCVTPFANTAG